MKPAKIFGIGIAILLFVCSNEGVAQRYRVSPEFGESFDSAWEGAAYIVLTTGASRIVKKLSDKGKYHHSREFIKLPPGDYYIYYMSQSMRRSSTPGGEGEIADMVFGGGIYSVYGAPVWNYVPVSLEAGQFYLANVSGKGQDETMNLFIIELASAPEFKQKNQIMRRKDAKSPVLITKVPILKDYPYEVFLD